MRPSGQASLLEVAGDNLIERDGGVKQRGLPAN